MAKVCTAHFPPYHLLNGDYTQAERDARRKLEKLYHTSRDKAWDGRQILAEALERHGGIQLPVEQRLPLARIFSVILWGELGAWSIAAELALHLEDPQAKMAATAQAFDEARHFATMRDYLMALGLDELPPLEPFSREILRRLLATGSIEAKLIGMQIMVENVALTLFRLVAKGRVEPVLADIMPYMERDEARHVGLGILHLPEVLSRISRFEALKLQVLQMQIQTFLMWGTVNLRQDFHDIGVDPAEGMKVGLALQRDIFARMDPDRKVAGLYRPSSAVATVQDWATDTFFPPLDQDLPGWYRQSLGLLDGIGKIGAAVLTKLSPDALKTAIPA